MQSTAAETTCVHQQNLSVDCYWNEHSSLTYVVMVSRSTRRPINGPSVLTPTRVNSVKHLWPFVCHTGPYLLFGSKIGFQPNIEFTVRRVLAVFTRSAITPLKVNRFGRNLEHSEYIGGGWPWRILGAIHAVATAAEPGEILLIFVR